MLLEVVISIGLLVLGLAVIGAQFQNSYVTAHENDRTVRALMLAESKLAELDTGLILPEELIEEDFGYVFPEYAWRMRIEPTHTPELNAITIQILHQPARNVEEEFDFQGAKVVETLYTFRATPRPFDLRKDGGLDDEQIDKLNGALPGGLPGDSIDIPDLARNTPVEELFKMLPPLLEAFGMSMDDFKRELPEELRAALEQFEQNPESQPAESGTDTGGDAGNPRGAAGGGNRGGGRK